MQIGTAYLPSSEAAPGISAPMAALVPLLATAEQQGRRDFSPFWVGQAALLAREIPAEALTRGLAEVALGRLR